MKKLYMLLLVALIPMVAFGCSAKPTLQLLNWGEYINPEMVSAFEDEYNVRVNITIAESNELMEEKIVNDTANFDVVIPSDYMIEKLWDEGYLQEIDLSKLTQYNQANFVTGISTILGEMFTDNDDVDNPYSVSIPYFWGVFGIMYNKSLEGLEAYIQEEQWAAIFEPEPVGLFTRALKVAMYDVPRFAYSASLLYANQVGTITDENALNVYSAEYLELSEDILSQRTYDQWATDMVKKDIEAGLRDLGFVYVGDFFDTFLILTENATTAEEALSLTDHIGIIVPDSTIAFYDGMVIPKDAENVDLAHQFIDFFLRPEVAYENSGIVGYTPCLEAVIQMIKNGTEGDVIRAAMASNPNLPFNPSDALVFGGKPLVAFSDDITSEIIAMTVRVKTN